MLKRVNNWTRINKAKTNHQLSLNFLSCYSMHRESISKTEESQQFFFQPQESNTGNLLNQLGQTPLARIPRSCNQIIETRACLLFTKLVIESAKRTAMMSQRSRGACSALRMSRMSEASLGSWSRATLTSSSEFCTGMYTDAIDFATTIRINCGVWNPNGLRFLGMVIERTPSHARRERGRDPSLPLNSQK